MRLDIQGAGGGVIDYDSLTATAADVPEGLSFIGHGSDDEQTGTLPDMENMHGAPGRKADPTVPIHTALAVKAETDTTGDARILLEPPRGKYPGTDKSFVGCYPADIGISSEKIANGTTAAGIVGTYGSDGTATEEDIRSGKVGYSANGRVAGAATDFGNIIKTISAGESISFSKGFHGDSKITAQNLASQTSGNLESWQMLSGQHGYSNGQEVWGSMPDCGSAQFATGMSEGSDYYAFYKMPWGCYRNWEGIEGWAPEARLSKDAVRSYLGVSANKIIQGQTIAGIAGSVQVFKYECYQGNFAASSNYKAIWDPNEGRNFYYPTIHAYPSGFKEIYLVGWTGGGDMGVIYQGGAGHYFVGDGRFTYIHMANSGSLTFTNTDIEIPVSASGYYWIWVAGVSN